MNDYETDLLSRLGEVENTISRRTEMLPETTYCMSCRKLDTDECEFETKAATPSCEEYAPRIVEPERNYRIPVVFFYHLHCENCRIRTFCGRDLPCGDHQKPIAPHAVADGDLNLKSTVDFDLNKIRGFKAKMNAAVQACYEYDGDDNPGIDIKCRFIDGKAKASVTAILPNNVKLGTATGIYIRENGTLRLEEDSQAVLPLTS